MAVKVTLLGTGVGIPHSGRSQSSLMMEGRRRLLFDCGAGALLRLSQAGVSVPQLDAVFLTHLHLDHSADLLPLANAKYLMGEGEIHIFGPEGTELFLQRALAAYPYLNRMAMEVQELSPGDGVDLKGFSISCAKALHSVTALGYRIEAQGKVVAYSGDTEPSGEIAGIAKGADLLIHECSFPEPYQVTYHTTPVKLAESLSEVGRIVLTHLYPQAAGHEADMAKAVAEGTGVMVEVGRDLQTIDI